MLKYPLLIVTLFCSINVFAQFTMDLPGEKPFKATTNWHFICENYALTGMANIQIAKSNTGGILKITVASTNHNFYIGGPVYVYLMDQSVITCTDKGIRQKTQSDLTAYYMFSNTEMTKLMATDIQSIRFTIKGKHTTFSSQLGNFTAVNKKSYFTGFGKNEKNHYLTAAEIAALK